MTNDEKTKKSSGFIALTSVIIIAAVIALLIIGMFGGAVGEMIRGGKRERSEEALSWANLCMEVALNELRKNPHYPGNATTTIVNVDGSCHIATLTRIPMGVIIITTIRTEGRVADYIRKIEAEVEEGSSPLRIISWKEI